MENSILDLMEEVSNRDFLLAQKCMLRTAAYHPLINRTGLLMDIIGAHTIFDIRLAELLDASPSSFNHDILGIYNHFDRTSLSMTDSCFCPRFANKCLMS